MAARPSPAEVPSGAELSLVDALVQTSFLIQATLGEVAADLDLTVAQMRLLGVLRDRRPRMSQLAVALGLTKQSTTGLVDRAQRRGLVTRIDGGADDGREVHVALTPQGRELAERGARRVRRRLRAVTVDLPAKKRVRLAASLTQIVLRDAELRGVDLTVESRV